MTSQYDPKVSGGQKLIFKIFNKLERGQVLLTTPEKKTYNFLGRFPGANAKIEILDWKVLDLLFTRGDIGFGEAYRNGLWESDDISQVILIALQNEEAFKKAIWGNVFSLIPYYLKHKLNRNTEKGSQKNIEAHYDLGNDFYRLWLDKSMTYSSAYFKEDEALIDAQKNKYELILSKLSSLPENSKVLEIGCGWGGFMEQAQQQKGWQVKGLTLSHEQKDWIKKKGLHEVCLQDYRKEKGQYDAVVSIEMFEALGKEYWSTYFEKLSSVLKKGGQAVIQTITMNDADFASYARGTDFIQQYIFPGGMLPSVSEFTRHAGNQGLRVMHAESFGRSYARTLNLWEKRFSGVLREVKALGFDDSFIRLWRFYLKYCEGAFLSGKTNVYQFHLEKIK